MTDKIKELQAQAAMLKEQAALLEEKNRLLQQEATLVKTKIAINKAELHAIMGTITELLAKYNKS